MDLCSLGRLFPTLDHSSLKEVQRLIAAIENIPSLFYGLIKGEGNNNIFSYLSPSVEQITGYPRENFTCDDGMKFFYSITDKRYLPHILEREAHYIKQTRKPDFDTLKPQLMQIDGGLVSIDGQRLQLRYLGVVLQYTSLCDIYLTFCTWHLRTSLSDDLTVQVNLILADLKRIHVNCCPSMVTSQGTPDNQTIRVVYPPYDGPKINKREVDVLQLIANGYSSKEIADRLYISFHTAETHRRHLLEKFSARNTAELIKKASKVFWFE